MTNTGPRQGLEVQWGHTAFLPGLQCPSLSPLWRVLIAEAMRTSQKDRSRQVCSQVFHE